MVRPLINIIGSFFTILTLGAIGTAITIGAVFWIYGRDLPSHESLSQYKPPTISRIYSVEGQIIDEFARERRLFTPADEVPISIKNAFISAEDKNFYSHPGYDVLGIISAIVDAVRSGGQVVRGASTITQQVMKNFLLDGSRQAERKIKEIILATRIENTLPKSKILELYLNEIFLGQNSYGVTAAAQTYFNKTLSQLAPHEAAFLAALPKAPSKFHPVREKDRLLERRNYVIREMWQNGYLNETDYRNEIQQPLKSVQNGDFPSFKSALPARDYFTDEIRRQLSRNFGEEEFFTSGMTVRATLDPEMQSVAAAALQRALEAFDRKQGAWRGTGLKLTEPQLGSWREALSELPMSRKINLDGRWYPAVVLGFKGDSAIIGIEGVPDDPRGHYISYRDVIWAHKETNDESTPFKAKRAQDLLEMGDVIYVRALLNENNEFKRWTLRQISEVQGAFMAMDVNTGRVIAMQGGFDYDHSVFNRATQADRQPGSSFKPFVYASALDCVDCKYTPATIVIDAPIEFNTPEGLWRPKNASSKFYGSTPLRTGIEKSRNLMTIRLAQDVGMETIAEYAERFGVYTNMRPYLANSLGAEETTLYKMVAAYAMFANGGERVEPTLVDRIQDRYGKTVYRHDPRICEDCVEDFLPQGLGPEITSERERVMDAVTAYQITSMLEGVVTRGTASRTVNLPVPTAGKTGTTNEAKDAWFVGFTSNIVAGCYIGYDIPAPLGRGIGGGSTCGPVFNEFMLSAIKKYGGGDFQVPDGGKFINLHRLTGDRLDDKAEGEFVVAEYFRNGEEPTFGDAVNGGFAMGSNIDLFSEEDEQLVHTTSSSGEIVTFGGAASLGTLTSGGLY